MKPEEYVETLVVNGRVVPVGMDDYGQCYFFEYVDHNGELKEMGCGTYNEHYKEEIQAFFDIMDRHKKN